MTWGSLGYFGCDLSVSLAYKCTTSYMYTETSTGGDGGYDTKGCDDTIAERGAKATIPPRSNAKIPPHSNTFVSQG